MGQVLGLHGSGDQLVEQWREEGCLELRFYWLSRKGWPGMLFSLVLSGGIGYGEITGEQGLWELVGGVGVLGSFVFQNGIWAWRLGIPD